MYLVVYGSNLPTHSTDVIPSLSYLLAHLLLPWLCHCLGNLPPHVRTHSLTHAFIDAVTHWLIFWHFVFIMYSVIDGSDSLARWRTHLLTIENWLPLTLTYSFIHSLRDCQGLNAAVESVSREDRPRVSTHPLTHALLTHAHTVSQPCTTSLYLDSLMIAACGSVSYTHLTLPTIYSV